MLQNRMTLISLTPQGFFITICTHHEIVSGFSGVAQTGDSGSQQQCWSVPAIEPRHLKKSVKCQRGKVSELWASAVREGDMAVVCFDPPEMEAWPEEACGA